MRCKACNVALTDKESVYKCAVTGEYYDLCGTCLEVSLDFDEDEYTEYLDDGDDYAIE